MKIRTIKKRCEQVIEAARRADEPYWDIAWDCPTGPAPVRDLLALINQLEPNWQRKNRAAKKRRKRQCKQILEMAKEIGLIDEKEYAEI